MLTTSVSQSLKRSSSASYEGICAEHTLLKAKGTKASTTFFLPRKSVRCQSSRLPVLRVKSGATSPTFKVFDSERLLLVMGGILPKKKCAVCRYLLDSTSTSKDQYSQALLAVRTKRLEGVSFALQGIFSEKAPPGKILAFPESACQIQQ